MSRIELYVLTIVYYTDYITFCINTGHITNGHNTEVSYRLKVFRSFILSFLSRRPSLREVKVLRPFGDLSSAAALIVAAAVQLPHQVVRRLGEPHAPARRLQPRLDRTVQVVGPAREARGSRGGGIAKSLSLSASGPQLTLSLSQPLSASLSLSQPQSVSLSSVLCVCVVCGATLVMTVTTVT